MTNYSKAERPDRKATTPYGPDNNHNAFSDYNQLVAIRSWDNRTETVVTHYSLHHSNRKWQADLVLSDPSDVVDCLESALFRIAGDVWPPHP